MSFETLAESLRRQKKYSDLFFDPKNLTIKEREELMKTFALSLHSEISDLVSAVNFKSHRMIDNPVDQNKILYKSVDAFRYILAVLNLWEITSDVFVEACEDKDLFLHRRHLMSERSCKGRSVVIFDIDDVIAEFRMSFNMWLEVKYNIKTNPHDKQYYSASEFKNAEIETETAFDTFILEDGFRNLPINSTAVEAMRMCKAAGYWIQLLTARPRDNLKCFYDTHRWLHEMSIPYDSIDFSPEKFLWLTGQEFYAKGNVVCAIDDSTKHASEYAAHGIPVIVPVKSYNEDTKNVAGITRINFNEMLPVDLFKMIQEQR